MIGAAGAAFATAGVLVACLLIAAYPAVRLVGFWLEGVISLGELIFYLTVILLFVGGIAYTWGQPASLLLGLLFLSLCAAVPLLNRLTEKRMRRHFDEEDMATFRRILTFDPGNVEAHLRLGGIHEGLKQYDQALAEYQQVLSVAPKDATARRRINAIIEARRRAAVNSRFCPRCDAENPPTGRYCRRCRTPLATRHALLDMLRSEAGKDIAKWTAVASAALLIGLAILMRPPVLWLVVPGVLLVAASVAYLYLGLSLE